MAGLADAGRFRRQRAAGATRRSPSATTSCATSWTGSVAGIPPPGSPIASGTPATYGPLPFLPPECQNAVVLQATLGHAEGRTFGLSVRRPNRMCGRPEEFAQHTRDVAAFWGRRLLQSRVIFLAGERRAAPAGRGDRSLSRCRSAGRSRSSREHARADDERTTSASTASTRSSTTSRRLRPDRAGWRELAARGLVRISLGVESGDSGSAVPLRQDLGRRRTSRDRRRPQGGGTRRQRLDARRRRRRRAGRDARRADGAADRVARARPRAISCSCSTRTRFARPGLIARGTAPSSKEPSWAEQQASS